MAKDWVDDEGLSREETLKRFEALGPQPTSGPPLPAGAVFGAVARTYGGMTLTREERVSIDSGLVSNGRQHATA